MKKHKKKLIIFTIVYTIISFLLSGLALITTESIKSAGMIIILMALLYIIITTILTQLREIILLSTVLVLISYLYTTAINIIVISFAFNLAYINLKFIPYWKNRKENIEKYFNKNGVTDKYKFNADFFDIMQERDKTIITMLVYGIVVLPVVSIEALEKIREKGLDIPFINEQKLYEQFLKIWRLSLESRPEYKRMALGLLFIMFFLLVIIATCFIIKEQRTILRFIRNQRKRDDAYWGENIPALPENDLIYIETVANQNVPANGQ